MALSVQVATELSAKKLYDAVEAYKEALLRAVERIKIDSSELTDAPASLEKIATEKKFIALRIEQFAEVMHDARKKLETIFIQAKSDLPALAICGRLAGSLDPAPVLKPTK